MAAPTTPYSAVTLAEIQVGKPCKQELKEKFRGNNLNAFEVLLAPGVSPGDAAVAAGHKHLGPEVDGTATISAQPQENLLTGGDGVTGFGKSGNAPDGNISWHNGLNNITPRRVQRSDGSFYFGDNRDKVIISKGLTRPLGKIKSAGGKGRFSCSHFIRRKSDASGVLGGTYRFGLHDGTAWLTGAYVDIDFDDVETEHKRFFFISDQIARPANFNLRFEWTAQPTDWDTVSKGDVIGYMGGVMITNGSGIAKWDISHRDGSGDDYLTSPTNDEIYWWDEIIEEVQEAV